MRTHLLNGAMMLFAVLPTVAGAQDSALDVFIGTVASEGGKVILSRCDLGSHRYILRDPAGGKVVAKLAPKLTAMKTPVYAEVIAAVSQENDDYILTVDLIDHLTAGKTCHLMDILPK